MYKVSQYKLSLNEIDLKVISQKTGKLQEKQLVKEMSRKKQGSLASARFGMSPRKSDIIRKENRIRQSVNQSFTKTDDFFQSLLGFIQHYELVKLNYTCNLSTEHIFTQSTIENEDELNFDVDLGVPYVESHHLDSGYQYDDKANNTITFPKISSAKEIFTSVLQIDNQHNTLTLDEENFTDQEEDHIEEPSFASIKSATFKKRSRKLQPKIQAQQVFQNSPNQNMNFSQINHYPQMQMSIVQRLKSTVLSRGQKLQYWNQRLGELDQSFTYDQHQIDDFTKSQVENKYQVKNSKVQTNHLKKKNKFEKCSTNKKTSPLVVQLSLNTNKENITPFSRLKFQTKSISLNQQNKHHKHPSNEKGSFQKDTVLNKNTRKDNHSKQKSLVRKIY